MAGKSIGQGFKQYFRIANQTNSAMPVIANGLPPCMILEDELADSNDESECVAYYYGPVQIGSVQTELAKVEAMVAIPSLWFANST